jgi:hypothetical protein
MGIVLAVESTSAVGQTSLDPSTVTKQNMTTQKANITISTSTAQEQTTATTSSTTLAPTTTTTLPV